MNTSKLTIRLHNYSNGSRAWRVSGTIGGERVRRNFKSKEEAQAERRSLEIRAMQNTTGLRAVGTFLTDAQLREAEAAFSRLAQLRQQREEEQRRLPGSLLSPLVPPPHDSDPIIAGKNGSLLSPTLPPPRLLAAPSLLPVGSSHSPVGSANASVPPDPSVLPTPASCPSLSMPMRSLTFYLDYALENYREPVSDKSLKEATAEYVAQRRADWQGGHITEISFGTIERFMRQVNLFFPGLSLANLTAERITAFCSHISPKAAKKKHKKQQALVAGGVAGLDLLDSTGLTDRRVTGAVVHAGLDLLDSKGLTGTSGSGNISDPSSTGSISGPNGSTALTSTGERAAKKTHNNRRDMISPLLAFAKKHKWIVENPIDEVVRYDTKHMRGSAPSLTAAQATKLMEFLETYEGGSLVPHYALLLFAGIRPDINNGEISKLQPEAVHLDTEVIYIEPEVSKVKMLRSVTIQPNLQAWLTAYPLEKFPLIVPSMAEHRTFIAEKFGLTQDILRHTFISMHFGKFRSIGETAFQAGNSERIIRKHYLNVRSAEDAGVFFEIRPKQNGEVGEVVKTVEAVEADKQGDISEPVEVGEVVEVGVMNAGLEPGMEAAEFDAGIGKPAAATVIATTMAVSSAILSAVPVEPAESVAASSAVSSAVPAEPLEALPRAA